MTDPIEDIIAAQGPLLTDADRREIRAFAEFLRKVTAPIVPSVMIAMDHWDYAYAMGGPTPPLRWEGDDS